MMNGLIYFRGANSSSGQIVILKYLGKNTDIEIPDTIDGLPVTQIKTSGGLAKNVENSEITSIKIPDTVYFTTVGAFDETAWYKNQPDGPVYIGNVLYKYKGTVQQESIKIRDNTYGICGRAFQSQDNLKEVIMPDTVVCMGWYVFNGCTSLENVKLSKNLRNMGEGVFASCDSLKEVTIPKKLYMCQEAFDGCKIQKIYYEGSFVEWQQMWTNSYDTAPDIQVEFAEK